MGTCVKDSNARTAPATALRFAQLLDIDAKRAQVLIDAHGEDYVYARGGFCMRRTKRIEQAMVRAYGYCVVFEDGELCVLDHGEARALAKKKRKAAAQRERRETIRNIEARKAERATREMFEDGKGERIRKRAHIGNKPDAAKTRTPKVTYKHTFKAITTKY